jgi:hypothetical protein
MAVEFEKKHTDNKGGPLVSVDTGPRRESREILVACMQRSSKRVPISPLESRCFAPAPPEIPEYSAATLDRSLL